ncbi:hypothetical protein J2W42_001134 [Rhizobium tibeticum]|uniref:hypothetical protein n=1 Tax=Rhizobium tibeticum TaxID=501024 RepID=UPI0027887BEB|nr:hypothetical protein [Rhizobium tibeticum]MDP9808296.1 hypothetical protein [Rhizobium tibeticum]
MPVDKLGGTDVVYGDAGEANVDGALISNRTVLVQPLNEQRSKDSDTVEVVDVKDIASAVEAFEPMAEFQIKAARLVAGDKVQVDDVSVTMTYGAGNAARIIQDFSPEALAGKVVADAGSEVERRPLLQGRLHSQVIEQLVTRLKEPKFAAQVDDPASRKAILDELDRRIAEIERIRDEIAVSGLDGKS